MIRPDGRRSKKSDAAAMGLPVTGCARMVAGVKGSVRARVGSSKTGHIQSFDDEIRPRARGVNRQGNRI